MKPATHFNFGLFLRRIVFLALAGGSSVLATSLMAQVMAANGLTIIGFGVLALFTISFAWLAISFWSGVFGFIVRLIGGDPAGLEAMQDHTLLERTAVVMPIYNEDTMRVAAGVDSILRGIRNTGKHDSFDVFILSDTTNAEIGANEESAVAELRDIHQSGPALYYRRRVKNIGRKAGNIEEFVHRWGARYAHMLVLDADSVMSGKTIVRLAQLMEANADTGIIQTVPMPANRETLFSRILQFAARLYGPVMASGMAFWAGGDANYYGHNAIIRLTAFARHCGLPVLPGAAPLGGEILSHDFVEAALINKGGFKVWLVPDMPGSYEEMPANVIDYAKRDRRWCQGNMQHSRLVGMPGLNFMSRLHLFMGVSAYATSPLWLVLLLLSTADAIQQAISGPVYFKPGFNLFPNWPVATDFQINLLLGITLAALFLPKLLGVLLVMFRPSQRKLYGGLSGLMSSVVLETVFSTLLAPVMMLFQSLFVASTLTGKSVSWDAQPRDDRGLTWKEGFVRHVGQTIFGVIWAIAVLEYAPDFFWWMTPVLSGLALAIPLSVLSSRTSIGIKAKRFGLFLTPDETQPSVELRRLRRSLARGKLQKSQQPAPTSSLIPDETGLPMTKMPWPDKNKVAVSQTQHAN